MSVAVVIGNPRPGSRTRGAAIRVAEELTGSAPDVEIELSALAPTLFATGGVAVETAIDEIRASTLVVFATPTYKGAYTGLLKAFLDRISGGALAGVTAIPVQLGADYRHALSVEAFLKPVLNELGASTPTRGLYLLDSEWDAPDALDGWLPAARAQLAGALR